jgi:hypothetical protein
MNDLFTKKVAYRLYILLNGFILPFIGLFVFKTFKVFLIVDFFLFLIIFSGSIQKIKLKGSYAIKSFIVYILLGWITISISDRIDLSLEYLIRDFQILLYLLLLVCLIKNESSYKFFIYGLFIGLIFSLILGIGQFYHIDLFYLYNESSFNSNVYADNEELNIFRVWGPFTNSLNFANYLSVYTVFVIMHLLKWHKNNLHKVFLFTLIICLFGIIMLTASRNSIIAFLSGLFLYFFINSKNKLEVFINLFSVLFISIFLYNYFIDKFIVFDRFINFSDDLKSGRLDLWVEASGILKSNFLLGSGIGNLNNMLLFKFHSQFIDPISKDFAFGHVENVFLTILYTVGFIGFVGYLFFWKNIILEIFKLKKQQNAYFKIYIVTFFVVLINFMTNPAIIIDLNSYILFIVLVGLLNYQYRTSLL